ncbi:hypothetical protein PAE9249_03188 [Paenibacillus sp. CECT 9249]|uniref:cache domain-containing sensor histidine kinase n=1 Tax=Paenibacillus sp. CECT 9249 TaxID=2845385 RepID=UPI001E47459A|nr:sensor histidine kinase [Paenibacillus sp. CECT 9249]CAH0120667.1 hypothetical protein PAE9249_03188 [Paenibacillus sp. CECT 9249]
MFHSLRARLIIMFSVLLMIPLVAIIGIVINVSTDVIGKLIRVSTSQTMNQYAEYVNSLTGRAEEVAEQVLASETAQDWIVLQQERKRASQTEFASNMKMQQYLSAISSNHSQIESVAVFFEDWYGIWSFNDEYTQKDWYVAYQQDRVRWTPSHYDRDQPSISMRTLPINSYIHPLTQLDTLTNVGLIKVNIATEQIQRPLDQIRLGDTGRVYLLQSDGKPVLGQDLAQHLPVLQSGLGEIETAHMAKGGDTVRIVDGKGEPYLLFYRKLDAAGWILAGVVSEGELFGRIAGIRRLALLCGGVSFLAAVLAAYWLSAGIAKPLSRLASSMRWVEKGDLAKAENRMPGVTSRYREVDFVISMFGRMLARLREYIELEVELTIRRRDAEYKALLLQMNPHFLYNTLEAIGSLAVQGRDRDVLKVTESLGLMLRYSLKLDSEFVPLQEELKYVRYYAAILTQVYGERIHMSVRDETGAAQARVLKFILQPLVENAVKYSMDYTEKVEIALTVRPEDGGLSIAVSDNGPGMSRELALQLMNMPAADRGQDILNSEGRKIGLRNVIARCRLCYGDGFRLQIESEPGAGTTIRLKLPQGGDCDVSGHDC